MIASTETIPMLFSRAVELHNAGKLAEARVLYERIIAIGVDKPVVFYNHAMTLHGAGDLAGAIAGYERALAIAPDYVPAVSNRADALHALERLDDALAGYVQAVVLDANNPKIHANLGAVLHKLGRHEDAVASYDKALALRPDDATFLNNRGIAAQAVGRVETAEADYLKATALKPDYLEAHRNAFWTALGGLSDLALVETRLAKTIPLVISQERDNLNARRSMLNFHIQHDLEQTEYLTRNGYITDGLADAHAAFRAAFERFAGDSGEAAKNVPLTDAEIAAVNRFRAAVLRPTPPAPMQHYLHPETDWRRIEEQYLDSKPEIVAIDNFLAPQALTALREFCLAATVFKTDYEKQYLGAFAEAGFVSPLHIAIGRDLQAKMPRIFAAHRLEQMWSFKYTARMRAGLNVHADFARVNLNFWVTPDDAVLDPKTGGLVVHDVPAPPTWSFHDYNNDGARIYDFLRQHNAGSRRVPYRCNRAVLFNSNLFHETDAIHFKEGYENRRVNITYLFGRGLRT